MHRKESPEEVILEQKPALNVDGFHWDIRGTAMAVGLMPALV